MNKSLLEKAAQRLGVLLTLFVLLAGSVVTVSGTNKLQKANQQQLELQFQLQARLLKSEVSRRLLLPIYGMRGAKGAYLSQTGLNRSALSAYVNSRNLEKEFPGATGFGLVVKVGRSDLNRFLQLQQQEFTTADGIDFSAIARQLGSDKTPDLYLTKYIEPLTENAGLLGLDVGARPQQNRAIALALRTGDAVLSRHFDGSASSVNPAPSEQPGDLSKNPYFYLLPIFRESTLPKKATQIADTLLPVDALEGFIYTPLKLAPLLLGAADITRGNLQFSLIDTPAASRQTVFSSGVSLAGSLASDAEPSLAAEPRFTSLQMIDIGGLPFQLNIASTAAFDNLQSDNLVPMMMQAAGFGLTSLLALAIWLAVTGRARAQALALRMTANLQRLASVARHTSNAVVISDLNYRIIWINDGFTRLYGFTLEEALNQKPDTLLGRIYQSQPNNSPLEEVHQIEAIDRHKTGHEIWVSLETQPETDSAGQVTGYMGIAQDITEKKRASQALANALIALTRDKEQLNHILEGTNAGTWEWNIETSALEVNSRWAEMLGYSLQDLSPMSMQKWVNLGHRKDIEHSKRLLQLHFQNKHGHYECEMRLRHKKGHWVWVMVRGQVSSWQANNHPLLMAGTQSDITQRKKAAQVLRESKAFLERAEKIAGVGGWEVDLHSNELNWSDETRRIYEVSLDEQPDLARSYQFLAAEHQKKIQQLGRAAIEHHTGWDIELPMVTAKGRAVWVRSVGEVELDNGRPIRLVGTVQDITAARTLRENLLRSNTVMHNIMENLPCGLWVVDADLNILVQNSQLKRLLDLPESLFDCQPTPFETIVRYCAARGDYGLENPEAAVQKRLNLARFPVMHQFERNRAGGKLMEAMSVPMPGGGFISTYTDISERRKMEQLKGEFIATVSHELRTPLTSIFGSLKLLSAGPWSQGLPPQVQQLIAVSLRNSERLVGLINDVLDIEKIEAGLMHYNKAEQALDLLLDQAIETTRRGAGQADVTLEFSHRIAGVRVWVNSDRIVQVLVNLLSNASKFSAKGGAQVAISMQWVEPAAPPESPGSNFQPVKRIRVAVANQGVGIPEDFRKRIFGRFTQVDGSDQRQKGGMGLGLTICKSIVQAHGGSIDYRSVLDGETVFYFDLPVMAGDNHAPVA